MTEYYKELTAKIQLMYFISSKLQNGNILDKVDEKAKHILESLLDE